jgi:hypothetical protein
MLCLPYAYVFSSTKLVVKAEQVLAGTEGGKGEGGRGRGKRGEEGRGAGWRNDPNNVYTCE